jgi:hypothetical protein
MEEQAMAEAEKADAEIRAVSGPLHGIPYGVKDSSPPKAFAPPGARLTSRTAPSTMMPRWR